MKDIRCLCLLVLAAPLMTPQFCVANPVPVGNVAATATVAPLPAQSGPIPCDGEVVLSIHYTPAATTPALRGYSIRIVASSEVVFTASDYAVNSLPPGDPIFFQVMENDDNDYTLDYAILGATDGITTEEDLFSITFHGAADGIADVAIVEVDFRDLDNQSIPIDYTTQATITVDCGPVGLPDSVAQYINLDVFPNPFNPRVTISFRVDAQQSVRLAIFDAIGRQVRELLHQELTSGTHRCEWDGRDAYRRQVPSGTYFVQMTIESGVRARSITLVR